MKSSFYSETIFLVWDIDHLLWLQTGIDYLQKKFDEEKDRATKEHPNWHDINTVEFCIHQIMSEKHSLKDKIKDWIEEQQKQHDEAMDLETKKRKVVENEKNTPDARRMVYADYLKTPEWRITRGKAYQRAGGKCQKCGNLEELQVHHLTYDHLGAEPPEDLIVLCNACHEKEHGIK